MYSLLISFLLLAILISFLCSVLEAVLLSITPTFAEVKLREGGSTGRHLKAFKDNIDRPLAAILTLNTIAHTVGAIGVGEQASKIWADANPAVTGFIVPAVMTLAILLLSEIIPKTLGANYWRELTPLAVRTLVTIIALLYPLVWFSQLITKALNKDKGRPVLSRADFLAMTQLGEREGVFRERESRIIHNLLKFDGIEVKDVMTPRTVIKAAPEESSVRQFHESNRDLRFSRIPTYRNESKDHITGYVLRTQVLTELVDGEAGTDTVMQSLRRDIITVAEDLSVTRLLKEFVEQQEHMALVLDGFGGTAGIVTMEDIIETLLGLEIVDETDGIEDMRILARRMWKKRAQSQGLLVGEGTDEPPEDHGESVDGGTGADERGDA